MSILMILSIPFALLGNPVVERYRASGHYPIEIRTLLASIDLNTLKPEERRQFDRQLKTIEVAHSFLQKSELFFLVKSSVYKAVLLNAPQNKARKFPDGHETMRFLSRFNPKTEGGLTFWIPRAIARDIDLLRRQDSLLRRYEGDTNFSNQSVGFRAFEKRANLALGWFYFLKDKSVQSVRNYMADLAKNAVSLLEKNLRFYVSKTKTHITPQTFAAVGTPPSSFTLARIPHLPPTENEGTTKSVETIVDTAIKGEPPVALPAPTDDWIPRGGLPKPVDDWKPEEESSERHAKNIITEPADEISPESLPEPTDDWILEL